MSLKLGRARRTWRQAVVVAMLAVLAACGDEPQQAPGGMQVPVSVITVQPQKAHISVELPGRVEAIKEAEIRARVTGIVQEINFRQGSDVEEGQLLFTIDPAQYIAARDQAAAQLQNAEADVRSARLFAERYSKLIKQNAVSRQEYDNAVARAGQAEAAVAAAKAALDAAEIDLGYTRVTSPISGRIGKSLVTEGALVSATQATQMATVQQLGKVYVDIQQSTTQLARLRKALAEGELTQSDSGHARAEVVLEDGTVYDRPGELLFSGVSVDPSTGQVNLRAEFDNPDHILLPGMYVRVRLEQGVDERALMVPKQALQRTTDGLSSLMLVRDGKVSVVAVTVGAEVEGHYVISRGLQAGDVVIVEGFQKIRPGAPVQPMPWEAAPATENVAAEAAEAAPASDAPEQAAPDTTGEPGAAAAAPSEQAGASDASADPSAQSAESPTSTIGSGEPSPTDVDTDAAPAGAGAANQPK